MKDEHETGWVIECDSPVGLLYWAGMHWSSDNQHAVRFKRALDAQRVARIYVGLKVRVADHMWYTGTIEGP